MSAGKSCAHQGRVHVVDHGDEVVDRQPHGLLDGCGVGWEVGALEENRGDGGFAVINRSACGTTSASTLRQGPFGRCR